MVSMRDAMLSIDLPGVPVFRRGKVRETFDLGDRLLMVATDRISAYDSVLPSGIPGKGVILTQFSRFWFERTRGIVPNHLITTDIESLPPHVLRYSDVLLGRSMVVRKAERIDVECVARGYLSGSAWVEYRDSGTVAGTPMPRGLRESDRLPEPIFTPATKAESGHDENITFEQMVELVSADLANELRSLTLAVYEHAEGYARERGVLIADTKFEFGLIAGQITLIDEVLTPDSSRFWDASHYEPGRSQPSFDKQIVRDWLNASGWDREPPAPPLPEDVRRKTSEKYYEVYRLLTGETIDF
jgi:phosphoribosylaminoimidazole-succinocarboxamide synthase